MLVALAKSFSQPHRPHPPALFESRVSQHPSWLPSLPQSVNHANKLVMNIMCVGVGVGRAGRGSGRGCSRFACLAHIRSAKWPDLRPGSVCRKETFALARGLSLNSRVSVSV